MKPIEKDVIKIAFAILVTFVICFFIGFQSSKSAKEDLKEAVIKESKEWDGKIYVVHDDKRQVTCYLTTANTSMKSENPPSISCLPDFVLYGLDKGK